MPSEKNLAYVVKIRGGLDRCIMQWHIGCRQALLYINVELDLYTLRIYPICIYTINLYFLGHNTRLMKLELFRKGKTSTLLRFFLPENTNATVIS